MPTAIQRRFLGFCRRGCATRAVSSLSAAAMSLARFSARSMIPSWSHTSMTFLAVKQTIRADNDASMANRNSANSAPSSLNCCSRAATRASNSMPSPDRNARPALPPSGDYQLGADRPDGARREVAWGLTPSVTACISFQRDPRGAPLRARRSFSAAKIFLSTLSRGFGPRPGNNATTLLRRGVFTERFVFNSTTSIKRDRANGPFLTALHVRHLFRMWRKSPCRTSRVVHRTKGPSL